MLIMGEYIHPLTNFAVKLAEPVAIDSVTATRHYNRFLAGMRIMLRQLGHASYQKKANNGAA
jgi:hypothetical protein